MKKWIYGAVAAAPLIFGANVSALSIDLLETPESAVATLVPSLLAPMSGITVVGGSEAFVGRIGDGMDPDTAQSGTYTGLSLAHSGVGPTISNPDGIFLTSGTANICTTAGCNTDPSFNPAIPGTGGDADLTAILAAASAPSTTVNDVNFLSFAFTVASGTTSVEADFVFGSDEFPDQGVTDVFAFIVDGVNYAFFPDGSLVSFVTGVNAGQFVDNNAGTGNYAIEYDGLSRSLHVAGILDPMLMEHTIKIAIGDTSDSIFDSGVFIGNLQAGTASGGGGIITPEPGTLVMLGAGLLGLGAIRRRRKTG